MKNKGKASYSKEQHLWFQCSTKAVFCTKHLTLSRSHCSVVSKHKHHNETPQLGALKASDQSRLWTTLRNIPINTEWSVFAIKWSSLLWDSWLRKSCACSQILHYNPAAGLPCCPLGMWCGTLGLDRHGCFKPLKCPSVLFSVTGYHHTLQSTDRLWVFSPSWRKTHCWHSFLNLFFLPLYVHCCDLLHLPKAVPPSLPLLNPKDKGPMV